MASTSDAELAVRTYLQYVADPNVLIDSAALERLEGQIDSVDDPIERIKAIAEYERIAHPDAAMYRDGFVKHAKAWAEANQIPSAAFERMGVDGEVLAAAGFVSGQTRRPQRRAGGAPQPASQAVSAEQIANVALRQRSNFTSRDLVEAAGGGSPMTVRKALQDLISSGKVKSLGPHPSWKGRGRAPLVYAVTKKS